MWMSQDSEILGYVGYVIVFSFYKGIWQCKAI